MPERHPISAKRSTRDQVASLLGVFAAVLAFCTAAYGWSERLGYTDRVSERLLVRFVDRFDAGARGRILEWKAMPSGLRVQGRATESVIAAVNAFFNGLPYLEDITHWKQDDYWATPGEFLASNGGDCEDYSIAKFFMLKELGIPSERLRITYVTSNRLKQPHMVLAYYKTPESEPLILDNLESRILPASQRRDLTPVYSFNDDEAWLAQRGSVGSSTQIRRWRSLLEALEAEARI